MLLNNFRPLLKFGCTGKFVNVIGEEANQDVILGISGHYAPINNHVNGGCGRSFNYDATTGANNYTNEQTAYSWQGVVSSAGSVNYGEAMNGFVMFIGSGDTPAAPDDYKLENAVNLSVTTSSCFVYSDGRIIVCRSFYNNTGEDVTIKELGCYLFVHRYFNVDRHVIMIGRKVLPNPVLIKNGEHYTFSYTINMSQVSFEEADS